MPANYMVAELAVGQMGLNGTKNQTQVRPDQLIVTNNLSYYEGTLTKEGGSAKYNASQILASGKVVGGWHWRPTATLAREIAVLRNGIVYRATGTVCGTFSAIATGLSLASGEMIFVEGGNEVVANSKKLFLYSKNDSPQVLTADGTSLATMANPAADWAANPPLFGWSHENRNWAAGNTNDPHRVYYSTATDHTDFVNTGAGTINIYPGEGKGVQGGTSFKGFLIVFKYPRGIYIVDTTTIGTPVIDRLNSSVGLAGAQAYCVIDDDILFMDAAGNFHLLSVVTDESKSASNLSEKANLQQWVSDNVNMSQLHRVKGVYYAAKREAHFAVAGLNSTVNNLRIVWDFNMPGHPRVRTSDKDTCEAIWLRIDENNVPRVASGDDNGFVWKLDQTNKDKDGSAYTGEFQLPHMDLSHLDPAFGTIRKNGHWLECVVEPTGNWDLDVTIIWDGVEHETITFNMGSDSAALGSFVLDTDTLGGAYILNKKRQIHGSGRRISIRGKNSGANQDFSIAKFYLHFRPGSTAIR